MEIAKIVGADDAGGTKSGEEQGSRIDLPLIEIMKLAPHAFRQTGAPPPGIKVTIVIPDLFDQLTKGKVIIPLSRLIAGVPFENRSAEATMHGDEPVSLPLPLVVASINPAELQKRTAKQEVDRGEKLLPNLFTPGSLKKPVATPQPAAAPAAPPPGPAPAPAPSIRLPESPVVRSQPPAPAPLIPAIAPRPVQPAPSPVPPPPAPVAPPPPARPAAVSISIPAVPALAPVAPPAAPRPQPKPEPAVQLPLAPAAPPPRPAAAPVPPPAPQPAAVTPPQLQPELVETPPPAPAPALSRAEVEAQQARDQKAVMEAAIEDASSREHGLVLYGLDINRAAAEEMVQRFNGVGRKLAEKIVANRTEFGLFKDVYDLARVPNVKGKVFQRITGMVWPAQLFRHRELVSKLIGVVGDEIPDVRGVAQRFKELEGFLGCIMIDQDGLVLSKTWEHPSSEALGAFAPQMFKKLSRYVKQLKMGNIKTLTFFTDETPITLVTSGAILFVALHKPTRFSKRQVELVQALATELGRKLDR